MAVQQKAKTIEALRYMGLQVYALGSRFSKHRSTGDAGFMFFPGVLVSNAGGSLMFTRVTLSHFLSSS